MLESLKSSAGRDNIVAIATPPGRGGVGVIRLSFPSISHYHQFSQSLFKTPLTSRTAKLCSVFSSDGTLVDQGLALLFPAPHSYTGETVLEFQGHGGPAVTQALLQRFLDVGAPIGLRLANAGEFTERAFLNDKLDLAQAEAVADLIDAASASAAKAAAASLTGEFSRRVDDLIEQIVHLRLLVEATLDFPEEEIEFLEKAGARRLLDDCCTALVSLQVEAKQTSRLRTGIRIVLAGRPNVGKSSLLNALAGDDIAIVTPVAGTTRDRIEQALEFSGIPVTIIDTAGLRDATDEVEKIGIERTRAAIAKADIVVHLLDASQGVTDDDKQIERDFPDQVPVLRVKNKIDLLTDALENHTEELCISAKNHIGLEQLKESCLQLIGIQADQQYAFLARERHIQALNKANEHLTLAKSHAQHSDKILDLFAEELRLAHDALGEITGKMLPDDLLGLIFSRFCIGK
jgi:tRNA modification GTPase